MVDIKDLEKAARAGKLDRREFIKRAGALGLSLPFATSLLSQSVHAAMPKRGGKFVQGSRHGGTTDTLDPGTHENGFMQNVVYTYANHLFEVDNTGELIPELAESFEASKDAKTWVIKLRKGVEFHNGKSFGADDVVSSMNHHRGEDSKSAGKSLLDAVVDMKKTGPHEVTFKLSGGNADFPFILSDYHFAILPDFNGQMDWQAGFGTGGFVLQSFEPGVRATFKRNPNYFKSNRAHFDEVETISLVDTTARQNAVMNQEVHAINGVDPKTVHLLGRNPSISILETTGTLHYTFPMRVTMAPFDNYDLRMAVKLSVDREQLVKKILLGHGAVGNDSPIASSMPYYNDKMPQRKYDPDKAKFHLKKAGMEGITLDLSTSEAAFSGAVDAALLVKDSAAKAGLSVNVVREPKDGYWSNVWNKKAWCACYWGGRPTPDWMFTAAYVADSNWNDTDWRTGPKADRFNKLVVAARSELDTSKRREMYFEAQELVNDDGGLVLPMFANYIHALNKKVAHDEQVAGNWESDGNKNVERWWFA
ncbi:MAG: ABC transporter substrate-binding protein [Gammaproteobacteria bacterium]|nr:ABC transporter substrate-binding protein [Gammaproteobacteria bacterium]MDH3537482.1 ABC transporter substrate-binding protein [Gammaproteobacteria bacterium]